MAQNTPPTDDPVLLTVKQTAAQLNLSIWTVYELIGNGSIKAVRSGRSVRIRPEWIEEYVNALEPYAPESA